MNKQKMVIAAGNKYGSTTFGLAQGFRRHGWDVHEIDSNKFFSQYRSKLLKVLHRATLSFAVKDYNSQILEYVSIIKPNVFLTVKGSYLKKDTLAVIGQLGVLRINYYPDSRLAYAEVDQSTFNFYDQFITTKTFQVDYLKRVLGDDKVKFLHHGYVGSVHRPPINCSKSAYSTDVLYIGSHSAAKEKWLAKIVEKLPMVSLQIYGPRWGQVNKQSNLKSYIRPILLDPDSYATAVNNAKINLGIHMGVTDHSGWYDLVSTRTFEIPACKGFMLHVDNEEVRQLFTPGEEIDVFGNVAELCEKIKYYLAHEEIRKEMVERAYRRCVPAYSYDERARVIADWIV